MSYTALAEEIKTLPEDTLDELAQYVEYLKYKSDTKQQTIPNRKKVIPGLAKGIFKYPDDINAGDDVIADMFEDYL